MKGTGGTAWVLFWFNIIIFFRLAWRVCQTCYIFLLDWKWLLGLHCIDSELFIKLNVTQLSEMFIMIMHLFCMYMTYHFYFLCSPPAVERLSSGLFQEVIITNTIPVSEQNYFPQLTILSVANLLGETIWRVHDDCSVSSIFQ